MPSAPQTSCVHATSPHHRKLGAGYVALPQMTGRRFGKPFILSPPALALRFRQNNGPTTSGDYQPSRSLSMAGSECRVGKDSILVHLLDNGVRHTVISMRLKQAEACTQRAMGHFL